MTEWIAVFGSTRIVAEKYDAGSETIYVRFPNGVEWWYRARTVKGPIYSYDAQP
jgi:hypothetical protein